MNDNVRTHATQYEVAFIRGWIVGMEELLHRCGCTDEIPYRVYDVTESMSEDEVDAIRSKLELFEIVHGLTTKTPYGSMVISLVRDGYITAYMER